MVFKLTPETFRSSEFELRSLPINCPAPTCLLRLTCFAGEHDVDFEVGTCTTRWFSILFLGNNVASTWRCTVDLTVQCHITILDGAPKARLKRQNEDADYSTYN